MSISSFHTQKPTEHSEEHMNRKSKVTYLIDPTSAQNEYWKNIKIPSPGEFVKLARTVYKKRVNQKMQKKQYENLIKEAVVNLNKHHTLKDVKRMMFVTNKTLDGYIPFSISVHKDEGVFLEYVGKLKDEWNPDDYVYNSKNFKWYEKSKDGQEVTDIITYRPSRDYYYNETDREWYEDETFIKKADLSNKHIYYNYHAHVLYSPFDLNTGEGRSTRKDMRSLQTLVANELKMERGQRFSNAKRKNHWQRKSESDLLNDEKREHQKSKQKSNEIKHENNVSKNQIISTREELIKERKKRRNAQLDLKKMIDINQENYETQQAALDSLVNILGCDNGENIEKSINRIQQKNIELNNSIKENERKYNSETEKLQTTIELLKNTATSTTKIHEESLEAKDIEIKSLHNKIQELEKDVYSEMNTDKILQGVKVKLKNVDFVLQLKDKNEALKNELETLTTEQSTLKKDLKDKELQVILNAQTLQDNLKTIEEYRRLTAPTGYEIKGEGVSKILYDYVEEIKQTLNDTYAKVNSLENNIVDTEERVEMEKKHLNNELIRYAEKEESLNEEIRELKKDVYSETWTRTYKNGNKQKSKNINVVKHLMDKNTGLEKELESLQIEKSTLNYSIEEKKSEILNEQKKYEDQEQEIRKLDEQVRYYDEIFSKSISDDYGYEDDFVITDEENNMDNVAVNANHTSEKLKELSQNNVPDEKIIRSTIKMEEDDSPSWGDPAP